jgi:murein DD-endopeptidase MepM/ murein hydrolase activator NlpD
MMNLLTCLVFGLVVCAAGLAEAHSPAQLVQGTPRDGCDCGTMQYHTGTDWSADEGTAVPVADDGVIVRVEEDEQALVQTSTGGFCGRYVVVKHSYPNGAAVFTRYAQLGRLIGADGAALRIGMTVKARDKVGEVGKKKLLHFEVRPVDAKAIDRSPAWALYYGRDPSMEWSKYAPVDSSTFSFGAFGGKKP